MNEMTLPSNVGPTSKTFGRRCINVKQMFTGMELYSNYMCKESGQGGVRCSD